MSEETNHSTGDKPAVPSNPLLERLGFVLGSGFSGVVWTNPHSTWMTQVWVCVGGEYDGGYLWYDARNGFDLERFFKWWEEVSRHEYYESELECARLNDY